MAELDRVTGRSRSAASSRQRRRGVFGGAEARADLVRRSDRPSRLLRADLCPTAAMVVAGRICRAGRIVPDGAGSGQQPGRLPDRAAPGRLGRRVCRLGRLHLALGDRDVRLRTVGAAARRADNGRGVARLEAGRGGGCRAGGVEHGPQSVPGPGASGSGALGGGASAGRKRLLRPDRGAADRRGRRGSCCAATSPHLQRCRRCRSACGRAGWRWRCF